MNRRPVKQLPTMEQIKAGTVEKNPLQLLLNEEPPLEWLKGHPTAKNDKGDPVLYLPIDRIDQLLTDIYAGSWTEIINTNLSQHSIQVTLRLFVVNPLNGRTEHTDGIGAASNRVGIEAAAPIAESLAKKNAAKKLGRLFGRDLSREFEGMGRDVVITGGQGPAEIDLKEAESEISNPVKDRILLQIKKTRKPDSLKAIIKAAQLRAEQENINEKELEEINEAINKKIDQLKIKYN
jgi:hypothetical protein